MKGKMFAGTLALVCGLARLALAGSAITNLDPATSTTAPDGSGGTYGFVFTLQSTETILGLGAYDGGSQTGLTGAAEVGIWDENGNLLAWTIVPAGTAATLSGDFAYNGIAALTLQASTAYWVGSYDPLDPITSFNSALSAGQPGSASLGAGIVSVYDYYSEGDGLTYPTLTSNFAGAYLGATFTTNATPIAEAMPEPTSVAVLLGGLAAVGWSRRQRSSR